MGIGGIKASIAVGISLVVAGAVECRWIVGSNLGVGRDYCPFLCHGDSLSSTCLCRCVIDVYEVVSDDCRRSSGGSNIVSDRCAPASLC